MRATVRRPAMGAVLLAALLAACSTPAPSTSPSPTPTAPVSTPSASPSAEPTPTPLATPTPAPPLSLALPPHRDVRQVRFSVNAKVPLNGNGTITVKVTNLSSERVSEIVLRWPTDLDQVLYLAPFTPSARRLTGFLVQPWTKWVIGPGEQGEPAGTTSLGWGPLNPGATLTIPLVVTRREPGAVAFDLQFLAGEALLTSESGGPATTRVSVP